MSSMRTPSEMPKPDLADLLTQVATVIDQADRKQIPALIIRLGTIQASLAARLLTVSDNDESPVGDVLLDVREAAGQLGVSIDWLYRRTSRGALPFVVKLGRRIRFSNRGIQRFIRSRQGR